MTDEKESTKAKDTTNLTKALNLVGVEVKEKVRKLFQDACSYAIRTLTVRQRLREAAIADGNPLEYEGGHRVYGLKNYSSQLMDREQTIMMIRSAYSKPWIRDTRRLGMTFAMLKSFNWRLAWMTDEAPEPAKDGYAVIACDRRGEERSSPWRWRDDLDDDSRRHNGGIRAMTGVFIDIDEGLSTEVREAEEGVCHTFDDVCRRLEEVGLCAVAYTSFNNEVAKVRLKDFDEAGLSRSSESNVLEEFLAERFSWFVSGVHEYRWEVERVPGKKGEGFQESHFLCVLGSPKQKMRVFLPFEGEFSFDDFDDRSVAIEIYKGLILMIGDVLGVTIDVKCLTPSQPMYMARCREGAPRHTAEIYGSRGLLDPPSVRDYPVFIARARAYDEERGITRRIQSTAKNAGTRAKKPVDPNRPNAGKPYERPRKLANGISTFSIPWATLDVAALIEKGLSAHVVSTVKPDALDTLDALCPFGDRHISSDDATGAYIRPCDLDAATLRNGRLFWGCPHSGCETAGIGGVDRLVFLASQDAGIADSVSDPSNDLLWQFIEDGKYDAPDRDALVTKIASFTERRDIAARYIEGVGSGKGLAAKLGIPARELWAEWAAARRAIVDAMRQDSAGERAQARITRLEDEIEDAIPALTLSELREAAGGISVDEIGGFLSEVVRAGLRSTGEGSVIKRLSEGEQRGEDKVSIMDLRARVHA